MKLVALVALVCVIATALSRPDSSTSSTFMAGTAKVNATLPLGTPLAGYNHAQRRVPDWPIPEVGKYTTFMMPSVGHVDPIWTRALVIDNGSERWAFCTLDGIGSDHTVNDAAMAYATAAGFTIPIEKVIFSSSHSHSGPGAISPEKLWQLAPAVDLLVPELQDLMAQHMASALVAAEKALAPAKMDIGEGFMGYPVTQNRRADISPYLEPDTVDPHVGVVRVDAADGTVLATLWNFAIHGVCYGPANMKFSGDIQGRTNEIIENTIGGISLFVNADAGDIDPGPNACNGANETSNAFAGSPVMAAEVIAVRARLNPTDQVEMQAATNTVNFGDTNLNYTLARFNNCTSGGPIDICSFCEALDCDLNAHMNGDYIENTPRFTAFRFLINGNQTVMVTMPGEALVELGWWIRNDTAALGFDQTLLMGYSNNHMGYFATPDEYDIGGYESQLTFWGIQTAEMVRQGCYSVTSQVQPESLKQKVLAKEAAHKRRTELLKKTRTLRGRVDIDIDLE